MTNFEKFHTRVEDPTLQPLSKATLPADAAQNYVHEMLIELLQIAESAQLKDLAGLLQVTIAAVEVNSRFL